MKTLNAITAQLFLWFCALAVLAGVSNLLDPHATAALLDGGGALPLFGAAGLLVNSANLSDISKNIKTSFAKGIALAKPVWSKFAQEIPSSGAVNIYPFLEGWPKLREWIGERQVQNVIGRNYTVLNRKFEGTIGIPRENIEDDNVGVYGMQAQQLGMSAEQLYDDLMATLLANSFTTGLCYDGQPFFDANHPKDGGVQSNKLTAALSAATLAAAQASLGAAKTRIQEFTDFKGRKLGLVADTLMVPPALEDTANVLYTNERLEDGKQNPYKGQFKPVVNQFLTSTTAWFLLATQQPMPALVVQKRTAPEIVAKVDLKDDNVFREDNFLWGARARGNVAYGFWQLAIGSTGAG